tara:strand:+ start:914 stop:1612 length:699 start_codon:yes stop_codon:yes gene_type:complete
MRWFFLITFLFAVLWVGLWGWQGQTSTNNPVEVFQDMDHQYKLRPQKQSDFFADGMVSRKPVEGTVPMGYVVPDKAISKGGKTDPRLGLSNDYYSTGLIGEFFGSGFPEGIEVSEDLLDRGEQRFDIYCSVCHGMSGYGKGVVASFWLGGTLPPTANLIDPRVAEMPEGQIFHTITNGKGLMGPYGGNIPPNDRWAIVAYLRALQLSQKADLKNPKVKAAFDAAAQSTESTQ